MRPIRCCPLALTHLLLAVSCADPTPRGPFATPIDIHLTRYIGRLVTVDALVGTDTARLILDTGGGETIVSRAMAAKLGCRPSGRSVGFRMNGDRVELGLCPAATLIIGGVPFVHDQIGIWDVQQLLPAGAPPVDGVLSLKTFANQPFTLRLAEQRLTLETSQSFREEIAAMTRLRSRLATGPDGDELTLFVRGALMDTAWFLIDNGNLDVVQAAPHLRGGTDTAAAGTWTATLTLEGLPGVRTTFRTRDIIYDGVLSEEFLRLWIVAFNLSANEVWAARAPGN